MPPKQTRKVPKFCHPIFSGQEKGIKKIQKEEKGQEKQSQISGLARQQEYLSGSHEMEMDA